MSSEQSRERYKNDREAMSICVAMDKLDAVAPKQCRTNGLWNEAWMQLYKIVPPPAGVDSVMEAGMEDDVNVME